VTQAQKIGNCRHHRIQKDALTLGHNPGSKGGAFMAQKNLPSCGIRTVAMTHALEAIYKLYSGSFRFLYLILLTKQKVTKVLK
jgi:hypothetical protein